MADIDKITLEVEGKAKESANGIDDLIGKLTKLDGAISQSNPQLKQLSSSFNGLLRASKEVQNLDFTKMDGSIRRLGQSLNLLNVYTKDMQNTGNVLKNISSGLNSMKRAMSTLGEATPKINKIDTSGLNAQVQELSKLSQISDSFMRMKEGAKAFNSSVNTMNRGADKFPEMMKKINNLDLTKFKVQVKDLASALGTFTDSISKTSNTVRDFSKVANSLPTSINKATSAVQKAQKGSSSSSGLGGAFGLGGGVNLLSNIYMLQRIGQGFGFVLRSANDFIETMNLFNVVMGENTTKAMDFNNTLQNLGIDKEQSMRFQASFYDIGKSLGMTGKNAYTLSEQFTKLAYDYSSLYNIPIEQSFEKLQSGIVGVVRPLRGLGKDISEAKLQETALSLGINESVRSMVQSDKATLRFITLMRQSGSAMNDLERTIHQPANALRILKAQFTSLVRELGALFIPMLSAVLPYLIAFTKFLRGIITDIAGLFGVKLFDIDFKGVTGSLGVADDYTNNMSDNLNKGAKDAKKIKDFMLGIDELNVLNTDTGAIDKVTGPSGAGGGGVLDGIDLEQFGYENLLDSISDKSEGILKTLNEWKTPILVVGGLLAIMWGVSKIAKFVTALKGIGTVSGLVAGAKGLGGLATTFFSFAGSTGILGTIGSGFTSLGYSILSTMGVATASVTTTIAGITGVAAVIAGAVAVVWTLYEAFQPAFKAVDLFGEGVSDVTKNKLEPMIDTFNSLDTELKTLDWSNKVITTADVNSVLKKVNKMVEGVLEEVDADKNAELKDLEMLQGIEGISLDTYNKMLGDVDEYYDGITNRTKQGQEKIKNIIEKASKENREITTAERKEINKINEQMKNDAITTMTESEKEQQLILDRIKYNSVATSLEQAEEILKNAKENHEEQIQDLDDWKVRSLSALDKKHKEEGIMNDEEYKKAQQAIQDSYDSRKETVDQTLDDITQGTKDNLGEQSKWINWETGEQVDAWEKWASDIGDWFSSAGEFFDENLIKPIVKAWNGFWSFDWLGPLWDGIWGGIKDVGSKVGGWFDDKIVKPVKKAWNSLGDWWENTNWNPGNWGIFGGGKKSGAGVRSMTSQAPLAFASGGFVPQRANFVSPDSWTAGEAGKELVGSYKGKTTVMPLENTSFVSTMYGAVYDAMRDASQENEITVIVQPKVQLDSKEIHQGQEEYKFKSGGSLIKKR